MTSRGNFGFLSKHSPLSADFGTTAERLFAFDQARCSLKLRPLVPQDPSAELAADLLKRLATQHDAAPVRTRRSRVTPSEGAATS